MEPTQHLLLQRPKLPARGLQLRMLLTLPPQKQGQNRARPPRLRSSPRRTYSPADRGVRRLDRGHHVPHMPVRRGDRPFALGARGA